MDKQLIERVVLKCADRARMTDSDTKIMAFALDLIKSIDAERGEGAFGFVREIRPAEWKFSKTSSWPSEVWTPLFLSPTIPEGMALVPKQVNYFDAQKIADEYGLDYNKFCAAHSAILAAAQGEQK